MRAVFTSSRMAQAWLSQTFSWFYLLRAIFYDSVCDLLSVFPKIFITVHYLLGLWFVLMVMLPRLAANLEGKR